MVVIVVVIVDVVVESAANTDTKLSKPTSVGVRIEIVWWRSRHTDMPLRICHASGEMPSGD